jgi:dTDP-4-dehydrorhamnose reductase
MLERARAWKIDVRTIARPDIDLARPASVEDALMKLRPDAVVSAAAYTAVDLAESSPALAHEINAAGAGSVARAASKFGIPVIHLSTDYVFDGSKDRPYREDDTTAPLNVYGRSKLEGERAVAAANNDHVILRTAWLYSPFGDNFARKMLKLARSRDEIPVVCDQTGSPTNAFDLADGIVAVARNLIAKPSARELRGVFHMTGDGEANWADFARTIFEMSAAIGGPTARVLPIPASAYPAPAPRPAHSRLDNSRLADIHGVRLPHWRQSLQGCIERLAAQD